MSLCDTDVLYSGNTSTVIDNHVFVVFATQCYEHYNYTPMQRLNTVPRKTMPTKLRQNSVNESA